MNTYFKTIRIGLLGFGGMGRTHAYAIANLPYFFRNGLPFRAEIAGIVTTSFEKSEHICRELSLGKAYQNEDELIADPNIDVIDICTPNIYHYESLKKAIAAGKHIYCEKPLCVSAAQAQEIAKLAQKTNGIYKTVFNNRYIPAVMRAKELVEEGRIGRVLSFASSYLHSSAVSIAKNAGWKQNREICGGGVLFDLGSHVIDMIYHLGGEFDSVCATTQIVFPLRTGSDGKPWQTNADEAFYMLAKLRCGAKGTISATKVASGTNDDFSFEIYGEKGAMKYSLMEPNWLWFYDNTLEEKPHGGMKGFTRIEAVGRYASPGGLFPSPKAPIGWLMGHVESYYEFLNSIHTGVPSQPNFNDALHVQRVMESAYRSDAEGKWITVS